MLRYQSSLILAVAHARGVFQYTPLIPKLDHSKVPMRLLTKDFVETVHCPEVLGADSSKSLLRVDHKALTLLASEAFHDVAHLLRPSHLKQLRSILDDPEASSNDRYVAFALLKNANIAAGGLLPGCQDTGTAIIQGYKGENVFVKLGSDTQSEGEALSRGVYKTYTSTNLRYSQMAPVGMYDEINTKCNLPAQIDIGATVGSSYDFMFVAKGGGSANKSFLFQETKSLLNPKALKTFLRTKIASIGTSACPPYHLAIVVGGTSAELVLKMVKYASCHYLDSLPTNGSPGGHAFRDLELEVEVHKICQEIGIGAQFGGKYFAHDVRVIRLPRHGASCPIGMGVSCSADRQILGRIDREGVWLEQLETNPSTYLPDIKEDQLLPDPPVKIDLKQSMTDICALLSKYPVRTRLALSGTIVVARDLAHARIREKLEKGEPLPSYFKDHAIYYAGPAKKPEGFVSGSFGPTTAGRMDPFIDLFQKNGGSFVTLAKGNRSQAVTTACKENGGFYLGSVGGPAALLATENIKKVEVLDFPEMGMEAVWKIEVEDFPAFLVVDDKGNDMYKDLMS